MPSKANYKELENYQSIITETSKVVLKTYFIKKSDNAEYKN
jgi:hypothetical protein